MDSNFYFYTGIVSGLYTLFAVGQYYTYSGVQLLTSRQAKEKIKKDNALVIDVRTQTEWNIGHFKFAKHLPTSTIDEKNTTRILGKNKTRNVVVYCNTGQRARRAAELFKSYGYENVFYIAGTYKSLK
jgi:phage shock protein E